MLSALDFLVVASLKLETEGREGVYLYLSSSDKELNNNILYSSICSLRSTILILKGSPISQYTMNRLPMLDPHVLTIADLKEVACRDMPAMYRGN